MIDDPQYLLGSERDKKYKLGQQKIAQKVFKENKSLRSQIKIRKNDIKENYLTLGQLARLGVKKKDIDQRESEGKATVLLYDEKRYYARDEIVKCM